MEPIKVEINVNVNLSEETKQFVANLLANAAAPKPSAPAPKPEPEPQANGNSAEITRDQVREACKSKLKTHQAELRAKLEELGATSITTLDESRLAEMYNFANSLS